MKSARQILVDWASRNLDVDTGDVTMRINIIRHYVSPVLFDAVARFTDKLAVAAGHDEQVSMAAVPGLPVGNGQDIVVQWPKNSSRIFSL